MRNRFVSFALACGCSAALANAASAQIVIQVQAQPAQAQPPQIQIQQIQVQPGRAMIALPIGGNRLSQADAIFVGRVVAIEPIDVEASQVAKGAKGTYRIAVVQVSDAIFGLKKGATQVRVGFLMQGNNVPLNGPGGGFQILPAIQPPLPGGAPPPPVGFRFPGNFQVQLAVGQDGLFTVNKHHKEDFYLSPNFQNFVTRQQNPNFDGQVKTAKQLSKVMANPVASLKAADKQDRYTAAALLISKYRTASNPNGRAMKLEPIDAAESKLILKALAEGDWKLGVFNATIPAPFELFNQLGINQKDGYNLINPRTQPQVFEAMQKWLDENNGKYRIQKYVVDPNAKAIAIPSNNPPNGILPVIRPLPPQQVPGAPPPPIRD
jgi:hypothetical protein